VNQPRSSRVQPGARCKISNGAFVLEVLECEVSMRQEMGAQHGCQGGWQGGAHPIAGRLGVEFAVGCGRHTTSVSKRDRSRRGFPLQVELLKG